MAFKTDTHGIAFKCNDIKLSTNSTFGMKLSQLYKQKGRVRIVTYTLPDMDYIRRQLERRPHDIDIIAHNKFTNKGRAIRRSFPEINVAVCPAMHSKILLIEPDSVFVTSANFGDSNWHETGVHFHHKEAHDWYVANVFNKIWNDRKTRHL